jgi:hypothetical protein
MATTRYHKTTRCMLGPLGGFLLLIRYNQHR